MAEQLQLKACLAIGCLDFVDKGVLFCDRHDAMLQSDIRTLLLKKYRPGKTPTKIFEMYLQTAREEILFAQTAGYRMPREASFEW